MRLIISVVFYCLIASMIDGCHFAGYYWPRPMSIRCDKLDTNGRSGDVSAILESTRWKRIYSSSEQMTFTKPIDYAYGDANLFVEIQLNSNDITLLFYGVYDASLVLLVGSNPRESGSGVVRYFDEKVGREDALFLVQDATDRLRAMCKSPTGPRQ